MKIESGNFGIRRKHIIFLITEVEAGIVEV